MDLHELLRRRRMVRSYRDRPVSREALDRVVQAALRAPSAGWSQGQSLVVVTDAAARAEIARLAGEEDYVRRGFEPWLSPAPVHLVVCVSEEAYRRRYAEPDKSDSVPVSEWPVPYWWVDGGATLMLVLLAAVEEGLAAGFLGAHALPGLSELLGLPPEVAPLGLVTLGHPAPDRRSGSLTRGRRPLHEVVHHNRWGNPW
jgi:nitroreductase